MENKINITVLQKIVVGWVATIPIAMLISIILWVTLPAPTRAVEAQISKICLPVALLIPVAGMVHDKSTLTPSFVPHRARDGHCRYYAMLAAYR